MSSLESIPLDCLWCSLQGTHSTDTNFGKNIFQILDKFHFTKFSDTRIQDESTIISIEMRIQKNRNNLVERYDGDESDKHLEARDRRY